MALVSKTSGRNPLQVQVLYPPPNETLPELEKRSDFAKPKSHYHFFKTLPAYGGSGEFPKLPQLHESVLSLRVGFEPIFWKKVFHSK